MRGCVAAALTLCLSACTAAQHSAATGRPDEQDVELQGVMAAFESDERGEARVTLLIRAPAGASPTVEGMDWELWIQGRHFASGIQHVAIPLSQTGATAVDFRLPLVFRRMSRQLAPQAVTVGLRGKIEVRTLNGLSRLSFERTLRVTLEDAPKFGIESGSEDEG